MPKNLTLEEIAKLLNYWTRNAEEDLKTAQSLFENKRYHHCLFFCHLFLEKLLKATVTKNTQQHALPIHNLLKLAYDAKINLTKELKEDLSVINEFNLRARYNDYKFQFYKKATKEYTTKWFQKCKEIYLWLKKELTNK